jgi:hypothetical protein
MVLLKNNESEARKSAACPAAPIYNPALKKKIFAYSIYATTYIGSSSLVQM